MADKLVTLAAEDLSSVRDLFKVDWPKHIISYSTIETLIKKFEKNPSLQDEIKIFCLNGDWARDGTFILHFQTTHYLIIGTLDDMCDSLRVALALLDFRLPLKFACVRETHRAIILDIAEAQTLKIDLTHDDLTECFYLPLAKVNALDYVVPDGYTLKPVADNEVKIINNLWPHRFPGSEMYLHNLIRNNISLGLYNNCDNEIVGWVLWTDMGAVGILQVRNEFRKKGFGSLLVKAFSKLAVQSYNVDITAHIVVSNEASKILFKQLGFVKIELNSWVGFKG